MSDLTAQKEAKKTTSKEHVKNRDDAPILHAQNTKETWESQKINMLATYSLRTTLQDWESHSCGNMSSVTRFFVDGCFDPMFMLLSKNDCCHCDSSWKTQLAVCQNRFAAVNNREMQELQNLVEQDGASVLEGHLGNTTTWHSVQSFDMSCTQARASTGDECNSCA